MIFLAVSGAMFVMVALLINGRQARTEFQQAVGDFVSNLRDTANDVSTGFASYDPNGCVVTTTHRVTDNRTDPNPGEQRCIFIGKVMQFAPNGDASKFQTYGVVGNQYDFATGLSPSSIATARPTALAPGTGASAPNANHSQLEDIPYQATVTSVSYNNGAANQQIGAFGFFTTFQSIYSPATNSLNSGAIHVDTYPIVSTPTLGLNASTTSAVDAINRTTSYGTVNPSRGITICLRSAGGNQTATVKLGGTAGDFNVSSTIHNGGVTCP
jgi:hypothetical protein